MFLSLSIFYRKSLETLGSVNAMVSLQSYRSCQFLELDRTMASHFHVFMHFTEIQLNVTFRGLIIQDAYLPFSSWRNGWVRL